jgi:hypothetical protein
LPRYLATCYKAFIDKRESKLSGGSARSGIGYGGKK